MLPPVYCNKINELFPFGDQVAAVNWLKENQLDTGGTSILVPFKDEYQRVCFLKPSNPNIIDPKKNSDDEANKDLRIMGAGNRSHTHGIIEWIKNKFTSKHIPHLNNLEGNIISLADQGFIIIYKKGEQSVGHEFAKFFEKEKQTLINAINAAQTNEEPHINQAEFLEKLSQLALDLDIKVGMTYFIIIDKKDIQHVYRHTFKQDLNNKNLERYLEEEKKWHESGRVKVKEHKSQNHHLFNFLKYWFKSTIFAAITAIGAGLILGIFITPPIGTIVAALVAVLTFISISSYGFYKADKNNPITMEYGTPEFETEFENTFSSRITQRFTHVKDFFVTKSSKAIAISKNASIPVSSLFSLPSGVSINEQSLNNKISLGN